MSLKNHFMIDFDGYGSALANVRAGNNMLMSGSKEEVNKNIGLKATFTCPEELIAERVHDVMYPNFAMEELSRYKK
jgi:hypothetical protein